MQEQTITIQIPSSNEHTELSFPNFMIFKKIILSLEIEIVNNNSGIFSFNFFTNSLDFLPFEAKVLIHFQTELIDMEKIIKLDQSNPSQSITFKISSYMLREMESYGNNDILIQVEPIFLDNSIEPLNSSEVNNSNVISNTNNLNDIYNNFISQNQDNINNDYISDNSSISKQFETNPIIKNILNKINNPNSYTPYTHNYEKPKKTKYNGLYNQGATCYINSAIQSMFHIPFFRKIVYKIRPDKENTIENSIVTELQSLFYDLEHGTSTCSTKKLTNSLGMNGKAVLVQQDIQEFVRSFTDVLEKIMKKDEKLKDKIQYIFGGKTIQTVKNRNGEILSSNEEDFNDLIIDVNSSVNESLKQYIKEETIDDYKDEKTGTIQPVTIQTKILNLPRVLQLLIKRYKYDPYTNTNVKDNSRMTFSDDLDLTPYLYKNLINAHYKLFAVIVHEGSLSFGHYFVYINPDMKDKWFYFSDTNVHQATEQQAINDNFGGNVHFGNYNDNYTWSQNCSAYILIYVRTDAISEMFMQDEKETPQAVKVPKRLTNYLDEKRQLENQKTEKDLENQVVFRIFNERGIIDNCEQGKPCLLNNLYSIDVSVDFKAKANEIYEKLSDITKLNINCIRLWSISKDFKRLKRIISPSESINQLRIQYLFFEMKDESDELFESEYDRTYFLILFTQITSKPFLFLKTIHYSLVERNELTGGFDILKYSTIVENSIEILNSNLGMNLRRTDANIYLANSKKALLQYPTEKCTEDNGALMILRISDNIENLSDSEILELEEKIGLKEKLKFISERSKDENEGDNDTQNIPMFRYFDNYQSNLYKLPDEFFEKRHNIRRAKVFSFNDISKVIGIIEVPLNIENRELTFFIQQSFQINNLDDEKEILLLFGREENLDVPSKKPLPFSGFSFSERNLDTIYYCIAPKQFLNDPSSETRIVQLSKDGHSISKMACYYMPESTIHPFIQFYKYNENIFSEGKENEKFPIRMFIVTKNNRFGPPLALEDENEIHFDNENILRIEKVANDQIGKELVLIYKTKVDKFNRVYEFGHPFYFAYIDNESLESFQSRIYSFLGKQEKFIVLKKRPYYQENYVMKEYIHVDDFEKPKILYLVYDK